MKKAAKFVIPFLLGALILSSIFWYLFVYDRNFTRDSLLNQARFQDMNGNSRISSWFYDAAYNFSGHDENVAIELANQYKQDGNYTKAELTLTQAIHNSPTPELYTALSRTYVEQDKLLDAVKLLDNVSNPQIKAQLDVARPIAPVASHPAGYYSEYIRVQLDSRAKYIFYTTDGSYPSISGHLHQDGVSLSAGETVLTAIAVGEEGLVSPVTTLNYTVTGVIEEVIFTDAALESAIRVQIGADAEDLILTNQLWEITEFTVPEGVRSLDDLKFLPNLVKLDILELEIENLEVLTTLLRLESLNLSGSSFPEEAMMYMSVLPQLKSLSLSGCSLSSIDALENAGSLTELDVSQNTIRNLDVLKTIPSLQRLHLQNNAVNDLSVLEHLQELEFLNVAHNAITTLAPLKNCQQMNTLIAGYNQLRDFVGLGSLSKLEQLSVDHNSIADVSALSRNKALKNLNVASNTISDIATLGELTELEVLDFSGNHVTELPDWPDKHPMQTIDGSYNALTSIDSLSSLQSLTHVYMDYNLITNIDKLENCFCLVQINVFGNAITDVETLRERDIIVNYDPTARAAE